MRNGQKRWVITTVMEEFLLDLAALHNISNEKKVALIAARFGLRISAKSLQSFYKRFRIIYGILKKVLSRAIQMHE